MGFEASGADADVGGRRRDEVRGRRLIAGLLRGAAEGPALTMSAPLSRARGADDGGRRRRDASYGVARDSHPVSKFGEGDSVDQFAPLARARR